MPYPDYVPITPVGEANPNPLSIPLLVRSATPLLSLLVLLATLSTLGPLRAQDLADAASEETVAQQETSPAESPTQEQEEEQTVTEEPPAKTPTSLLPIRPDPLIAPSGPDVFMLPDEDGKLRMVLGFRYEDFLRAWQRRDKGAIVSPPQFVYESLTISGKADEAIAHLSIELQLLSQAKGWIEVPLQMPGLIVKQHEIEKQVDGECVVYDPKRQGYFLWLKSQPGSRRRLKLEGLVRLNLDAGAPSLQLHAPRAAATSFVLLVPNAEAQFQASLGMTIEATTASDQGAQVRLTGQASPLRLQWTSPKTSLPSSNLVIESVGKQTVRIARRTVQYGVHLEINSFETPLEIVRVRLPEGAKLSANLSTEEYRIEPSESETSEGGQIVEIRAKQPRTLPWQVELAAERTLDGDEQEITFAAGGFEVLDAFRQSGTLDLQIEELLQAYFDLDGNLEQVPLVEQTRPNEGAKTIASFEYARFPWKLTVHVLPQRRRVSVRPQYELVIDSEEARLHVDFDYQLTGARTFFLRIDMHGWRLTDDPLESGGTIDQNEYTVTQQGLLNLPLLNQDTPRVRLSFVARKDVLLGANSFPLPEPLGVFVADGQLSVRSEASLQVMPKLSASDGLSRVIVVEGATTGPPGEPDSLGVVPEPNGGTGTLFRTFQPAPTLAADVSLRNREIAVGIETQVTLAEQAIRTTQKLKYQVKYRPVSQVLIQVPDQLWQNDTLAITLGSEALQFGLEVSSQDDSNDVASLEDSADSGSKRLVLALPRPLEGAFQIDVAYTVPLPPLINNASIPLSLSLAKPSDPLEDHQARVQFERPLRASLNQAVAREDWSYDENAEQPVASKGFLQLQTSGTPLELPLLLQLDVVEGLELATLERVWLQSWILSDRQQTRAVYRFHSDHTRVGVQLPVTLDGHALEVLLEGRPVPFEQLPPNRLSISIPEERRNKSQTLELRYQLPVTLPQWGSVSSQLPVLKSRSSNIPVYWQVVLPPDWHVSGEPDQLTGDYWLGWKDYRWGRQPNLYQADLEQSTGATSLPAPPPAMNQYLFQTFQLPSEIELAVVHRFWLVLVSTLLAFGIGLVCLYTSLVRQKVFWLILALGVFALVFIRPEISLLVVQAIFWGGVMTLGAALLRRIFSGTPTADLVFSSDLLSASTAATESWSKLQGSSPVDKQETTASAPVSNSE
ncbi:MAG: hypothetical protein MI725_09345 [Pirellulales bacterium]|nr:hypothetical protein [Pirellulales bacterium]